MHMSKPLTHTVCIGFSFFINANFIRKVDVDDSLLYLMCSHIGFSDACSYVHYPPHAGTVSARLQFGCAAVEVQ